MSDEKMPATEVNSGDERELVSYEFAFHVLPTVAEGEVANVFDKLKNHITKIKGEILDEESPKRFDLAYDIERYLEGKNRKFSSAYFGWVRFRIEADKVTELNDAFDGTKELLRFLLLRLTKVEEQNPFRFHDSIVEKKVRIIDEDEESDDSVETDADEGEENDSNEENQVEESGDSKDNK